MSFGIIVCMHLCVCVCVYGCVCVCVHVYVRVYIGLAAIVWFVSGGEVTVDENDWVLASW